MKTTYRVLQYYLAFAVLGNNNVYSAPFSIEDIMVAPPAHKASEYFRIRVSATEKNPSQRHSDLTSEISSLSNSLVVIPHNGYLVAAPDDVGSRLNDNELWVQSVPFQLDEAIPGGDVTKKRLSLATKKGIPDAAHTPIQTIVVHLGESQKLAILGLTADKNEVEEDPFSWDRAIDGVLRLVPTGGAEVTDLDPTVKLCKSNGKHYELIVRDTSAYAAVEEQDSSADCVAVTLTTEVLEHPDLPTYWESLQSA